MEQDIGAGDKGRDGAKRGHCDVQLIAQSLNFGVRMVQGVSSMHRGSQLQFSGWSLVLNSFLKCHFVSVKCSLKILKYF